MKKSPWFKFYPQDWLSGTRCLSPYDTGIYITLIAMMYDQCGPLIFDRPTLAHLCGTFAKPFSASVDRLIAQGKLIEDQSGLSNRRTMEVLAERVQKYNLRTGENIISESGQKIEQNQDSGGRLARSREKQKQKQSESSRDDSHTHVPPHDECALAYDAWNRLAEETGLTRAQVLNQTRRASLARRIGEAGGLKAWLDVLEKVRSSSFCNGGGDRGWRIDFDAMIQAKTFTKLMEGSFDDKRNGSNGFHRTSSGNSLKEKIGRAAKIFDERRASATGSGPDSGLLPFPRKGPG
jgi:uncharacterized protein YdaU (DUF1376 family)